MMKGKLKKVLAFLGIGITLTGIAFGLANISNNNSNSNITPSVPPTQEVDEPTTPTTPTTPEVVDVVLSAPQHLTFDEAEGIISWDSVENANTYTLTIDNGESIICDENSYEYDITSEVADGTKIDFSVKANGHDNYLDSDKTAITHTVTMQQEKLKKEIYNNVIDGFDHLTKKIFIFDNYYVNNLNFINYVENTFTLSVQCDTDKLTNACMIIRLDMSDVLSFEQADTLEQLKEASGTISELEDIKFKFDIQEVGSSMLDLMLNSNNNQSSKLVELANQGYTITTEYGFNRESNATGVFMMHGLFKCVRGDETIYLQGGLTATTVSMKVQTTEEALNSSEIKFQEKLNELSKASEDYLGYLESTEQESHTFLSILQTQPELWQ